MTNNIIPFPGWTKLDIDKDIDASSMLEIIAKENSPLSEAIVIICNENNEVKYYSSGVDYMQVYWHLRAFMKTLEEEYME